MASFDQLDIPRHRGAPAADFAPVLDYTATYWPRIIRFQPQDEGALIGLPYRYLVPSHEPMFREFFYWDSVFMALGLVGTEYEQLIIDMTENMAYLFNRFGLIPNANRYHFLSRSQPPLFTTLIWLAYGVKQRRGDLDAAAYLGRMMDVAEREHEGVWMGTAQPHHRQVFEELSRYFDSNYLDVLAGCESGWDHSTRCDDRWLDHLPIDLNSILYARESDFAYAADILGRPDHAEQWRARAAKRVATMHRLLWDEQQNFFLDYDWKKRQRNPHPSLAGFYPLWAGLATPEQAERMVRSWLPRFEKRGGLVTTLKKQHGRQWGWPNGWAPLQWLVVAGLERYGYTAEARRIMHKWCENCAIVFNTTGALLEKYNVVNVGAAPEPGLYGTVRGFGWTNAVLVDFARRLGTLPEPRTNVYAEDTR